ncbi:unnamed protein product [marine sediment metagenome]|uniref:Uncharacterized protein n=1 Tax=marine sediment metagenome TaxID=412755 RepID=X1DWM9_9ZZZZ
MVFYSIIYGIIPYELIDTFPMGQYESLDSSSINDVFYQNSIKNSEAFLKINSNNYKKCVLLIPEFYINQFNESTQFPNKHPINGLKSILNRIYESNSCVVKQIDELFQFLKEE